MSFLGLVVWFCSIAVAYKMAKKRGRDTNYAIIGGLLFGWLCPLYYLIVGRKKEKVEVGK